MAAENNHRGRCQGSFSFRSFSLSNAATGAKSVGADVGVGNRRACGGTRGFRRMPAVRGFAFQKPAIAFQTIHAQTAAILVKATGRLLLPAAVAKHERRPQSRIRRQDFDL